VTKLIFAVLYYYAPLNYGPRTTGFNFGLTVVSGIMILSRPIKCYPNELEDTVFQDGDGVHCVENG